jgi:hypothetical protein
MRDAISMPSETIRATGSVTGSPDEGCNQHAIRDHQSYRQRDRKP